MFTSLRDLVCFCFVRRFAWFEFEACEYPDRQPKRSYYDLVWQKTHPHICITLWNGFVIWGCRKTHPHICITLWNGFVIWGCRGSCLNLHIPVCIHIHMHIHVCICTFYICIHTCTHECMHAYIRTYIQGPVPMPVGCGMCVYIVRN